MFGAGAMGTAMAMHLSRAGNDVTLWASPFDERVLPALRNDRRHLLRRESLAARQVRPPHVPNEQRVARENHPRARFTVHMRRHADALRRMSRSMEHTAQPKT